MLAKVQGNFKKGAVVIVKEGICTAVTIQEQFHQPYDALFNVDKQYSNGEKIDYEPASFSKTVDAEASNIRKLLKIIPSTSNENKKAIMSMVTQKTQAIQGTKC